MFDGMSVHYCTRSPRRFNQKKKTSKHTTYKCHYALYPHAVPTCTHKHFQEVISLLCYVGDSAGCIVVVCGAYAIIEENRYVQYEMYDKNVHSSHHVVLALGTPTCDFEQVDE